MLKGIGIILVFCVLLKFLGFMLASAFMIPTIMRLMGEKRIKVLAGLTVGVLVAYYLICSGALRQPLLEGSLIM